MDLIKSIYAYVTENSEDGTEGIMSVNLGGKEMPLVVADVKNLEMMKGILQSYSDSSGKTFKLVKFSQREEVSKIIPDRVQKAH